MITISLIKWFPKEQIVSVECTRILIRELPLYEGVMVGVYELVHHFICAN